MKNTYIKTIDKKNPYKAYIWNGHVMMDMVVLVYI